MKLKLAKTLGAALLAAGATGVAYSATITISCGSNAANLASCQKHAEEWAKKTGNAVRYYQAPASSTENLALLRQQFAAKSSDLDVVMIDVVWPGIIKDHLVDLKKYTKGAEANFFPTMVANNTIDGKLVALPWYSNIGVLYYRKDLLEKYRLKPPETWADLTAAAKKVQDGERAAGSPDFQGLVFQAKADEGLSCLALEWIYSYGGGEIVDPKGNITINNEKAAKALEMAGAWVGTVAPIGVLNYGGEEARGVFQKGEALFMRNWPYAWALSQGADSPVKGKVGVVPLPAGPGGKKTGTLGGWQFAVPKYSKHIEGAADLAIYLTSAEVQKKRAIEGGYVPSMPALFKDKDVVSANPFLGELLDMLNSAVARPSTVTGTKYPEVSNAFWDATHQVLSKNTTGAEAVKKLSGRLRQIKRTGW
jgi:trehalose/maltose transport system substrate-binding protein